MIYFKNPGFKISNLKGTAWQHKLEYLWSSSSLCQTLTWAHQLSENVLIRPTMVLTPLFGWSEPCVCKKACLHTPLCSFTSCSRHISVVQCLRIHFSLLHSADYTYTHCAIEYPVQGTVNKCSVPRMRCHITTKTRIFFSFGYFFF